MLDLPPQKIRLITTNLIYIQIISSCLKTPSNRWVLPIGWSTGSKVARQDLTDTPIWEARAAIGGFICCMTIPASSPQISWHSSLMLQLYLFSLTNRTQKEEESNSFNEEPGKRHLNYTGQADVTHGWAIYHCTYKWHYQKCARSLQKGSLTSRVDCIWNLQFTDCWQETKVKLCRK